MQSKPLWCWINLEKKIVLEFLSSLSSQIKMVQGFEIHLHHDHVIKWKRFLRFWSFVRGIHRSPVNSPHKGQWVGALMFSLICGWINGWVNNREVGDLRRHRAHYDVTVMDRQDFPRFQCEDKFRRDISITTAPELGLLIYDGVFLSITLFIQVINKMYNTRSKTGVTGSNTSMCCQINHTLIKLHARNMIWNVYIVLWFSIASFLDGI